MPQARASHPVSPPPQAHLPRRKATPPAAQPKPDPLHPTIFHEPWWLDAAAPDAWREVTVTASGKTVGRLPYAISHQPLGRTGCVMPPFCHFVGPAIDAGNAAACNKALRRDQITRELIEQLPDTGFFSQRMHRDVPDVLVFAEMGFYTPVQFTFEIAPDSPERLWSAMRDKTRNIIRRAEERCSIDETLSGPDFAAFYVANAAATGNASYYRAADIARITTAATARDRGRILSARAADGSLSAAIFCVWDDSCCYYLLSMRDRGRDDGATSMLVWHAIRRAAARSLIFDFDGLFTRGNRVFFTGFGGTVRPRFCATRKTLAYRAADQLAARLVRIGLARIDASKS